MKSIVRRFYFTNLLLVFFVLILLVIPAVGLFAESGQESSEATQKAEISAEKKDPLIVLAKTIGASLAIGICAIATSYVQAKIGAAGIGSITEDQKNFGMALIFLVIPETILIFGFVIAATIIFLL